jgi:hypothetical protein
VLPRSRACQREAARGRLRSSHSAQTMPPIRADTSGSGSSGRLPLIDLQLGANRTGQVPDQVSIFANTGIRRRNGPSITNRGSCRAARIVDTIDEANADVARYR